MDWNKLKPQNYHTEPVEHVLATNLIELNDYDKLYENQNNTSHHIWKEFCEKHNTKAVLHENFDKLDLSQDIICLWFFKERSDGTSAYVHLAGKQIKYHPNVLLLTKCKTIKFFHSTKKYIRSPVFQMQVDVNAYNNIVGKFQK
tara:strand:+ start:365 stop:796 length:432 start_codon:yes stop_codon:yes gene_type:complete